MKYVLPAGARSENATRLALLGAGLFLGLAGPALAQERPADDNAAPAVDSAKDAKDTPKPTGFWERDTLTGDWGGCDPGSRVPASSSARSRPARCWRISRAG